MTEQSASPVPYRVAYSQWVRNELRSLIARAKDRGLAPQVLVALKTLDYRLRIYPQFGQPLRDLELKPAQLWIGVIPPLVARYSLDEERRLVLVFLPLVPLPKSGLQT